MAKQRKGSAKDKKRKATLGLIQQDAEDERQKKEATMAHGELNESLECQGSVFSGVVGVFLPECFRVTCFRVT